MDDAEFSSFEDWLTTVPRTLTGDPIWRMEAYRLALFTSDIGWHDISKCAKDRRTAKLADQLYRALGSIGANIAEGYSRRSGKDRARLYEYALGSARESRHWYYCARHVLSERVVDHRLSLITQIIRLLLKMIPDQRRKTISESSVPYDPNLSSVDERRNVAFSALLAASIPYA